MRRHATAVAGLLCGLLAALPFVLPPGAEASRPATGYARIASACPAPKPGEATCFALVREAVPAAEAGTPGVHPFALRTGAASSGPAGGLTPAQLASAYGYDPAAGGSGQTIGVVDAFDDPNIEADLESFDSEYGIAACTKANGCLTKVGQTGETTSLPAADKEGWSVEISLDVEAAHAACPDCKILLVEAKNPEFTNLAEATDTAVALGAGEVSNSYGGAEAKVASAEAAYNHPGVVIAAATGDFGWDSWTRFNEGIVPPVPARPNIPASLPGVVAVGGTSLRLGPGGERTSETVWNGNGFEDAAEDEGATGGGCSVLYGAQLWQQDAPGYGASGCAGTRLDADVAAVADPLTGFDIFDSYECGAVCKEFRRGKSWLTIGGTSLSTPLISAMYALAGGAGGVSDPALTLYGHLGGPSLFDVTQGGNGYCDKGTACGINAFLIEFAKKFPELTGVKLDCEGTTACNAASGFDGPTGVGTPASISLFQPLHPAAAIVPPATLRPKTAEAFGSAGSSDPYPGATLSYAWAWGDGTAPSAGASPSHTYSAPGEYTVTLTLTDSYGLKAPIATKAVKVTEPTAEEIKEEEEAAKKKAEEAAKKKHAEEEEEAAKRGIEEEGRKAGQGVEGFKSSSPGPKASLAGTTWLLSPAGLFTAKISCPAGESTCEGTIAVRTLGAVSAGRRAAVLTLASGHFKVAGGRSATVRLHLSGKGLRLLKRRHSLRVRVTLAAHDPAGAVATSTATALLREAHRHG